MHNVPGTIERLIYIQICPNIITIISFHFAFRTALIYSSICITSELKDFVVQYNTIHLYYLSYVSLYKFYVNGFLIRCCEKNYGKINKLFLQWTLLDLVSGTNLYILYICFINFIVLKFTKRKPCKTQGSNFFNEVIPLCIDSIYSLY